MKLFLSLFINKHEDLKHLATILCSKMITKRQNKWRRKKKTENRSFVIMLSHWSNLYRKSVLPLNFWIDPPINFLHYLNNFDVFLLHTTKQSSESGDEDQLIPECPFLLVKFRGPTYFFCQEISCVDKSQTLQQVSSR